MTKHASFWLDSTHAPKYSPLEGDAEADVGVIGGGIAGLTTAYLLAREGVRVTVIDSSRIISGVTGFTTAKISSNHGLIYQQLARKFGEDGARTYGQANEAALNFIAETVELEQISCDFRRQPAYLYTERRLELPKFAAEIELTQRLGLPSEPADKIPLPFETAGGLVYRNQAEFHPRSYLLALVDRITEAGGTIYEQTRATDVRGADRKEVITDRGTIRADYVVVATHYPFLDRGLFFAKIHPKRSYVVAAYMKEPPPPGMYASTGSPTYTIRSQPTPKGELVMFLGGSHRPGEGDEREWYTKVEDWARERFPIREVAYRWSTQDNVSVDLVPYIGPLTPLEPNVTVATGFHGWGMTLGTLSGMILSDRILSRPNEYADFFSPNRVNPSASAQKVVIENAHAGLKFVADYLKRGEKVPVSAIRAGEGRILRINGEKVGVFRDESGKLHGVSPVCTHLYCQVHFNNAERTWDCPCHGSRFDHTGNVIQGPATKDLERKKIG